jgi:hypothetical protein
VAGVLIAAILVLAPVLMLAPAQEPASLAVAQLLICGVILGIGRQGIDILLLRLIGVSVVVLIGFQVGQHQGPVCIESQNCVQSTALAVLTFAIFGMTALSVIAVPTALLWSRRFGSLKPELPWPKPKAWWQWVLLMLVIFVGIPVLALLLGIPLSG